MLPLKDTVPARSFPVVNWLLIAANIVLFFVELSLGPDAELLLAWLGVESCCRASLAFYNDEGDIDALIAGLDTVWRTFNG